MGKAVINKDFICAHRVIGVAYFTENLIRLLKASSAGLTFSFIFSLRADALL